MKELTVTGLDLCILMSAMVWVKDCPFDKAEKPGVGMSSSEMNILDDKLVTIWLELRDRLGVDEARAGTIKLLLTTRELFCLHRCLCGILEERAGDPIELSVRAGEPEDVNRLEQQLRVMVS